MRTSVSLSLSIALASASVRCKAVALDTIQSSAPGLEGPKYWGATLLDCSWNEADVERWLNDSNSRYWQRNWACSAKQLPTKLNQKKIKPTIACIGDSNTRGIGLGVGKDAWWTHNFPAQLYLHRLLRHRYNVVNLGIAGSKAQKTGLDTYWNMPHWNHVLPVLSNVRIVIVQLGTNDATAGSWNRTAFRHDYSMMLHKIAEMHPRATIITSVPPPVSKYASEVKGYAYVNTELGTEIDTARDTANVSVPVQSVNMQRVFAGQDLDATTGMPRALHPETLLQGDGIHVSHAGHILMADTFASFVPMP
jgi:lysophospholipase L1-like esterase